LSVEEVERWQAHLAARLHDGEGGAQTLAAFMERIDQLGETADERGEGILSALYDYAEQIAP
jgi:exodeoxyribonuclease-1